jgi:arylsulfatase A-like enzyme
MNNPIAENTSTSGKPGARKRPNVIYIVADDLGYADLGCYGGREPVSPNLDKLAANGIRFTQGYSNAPVCSPTRFALMTARYQYRLRGAMEEPLASKARGNAILGLPPSMPTMPSLLKEVGYSTALIGKWHLGFEPHFGPLRSGYDEHFGPMAGGVDYFTHKDNPGVHDLWLNGKEEHRDGYLTDLLSTHTVEYIDRHAAGARANTPFFISLHYTAPHWPWETRDDYEVASTTSKNLFHLDGGNIHTYRKMIHHMDEGIGWIVEALKKHQLLDNTLIIFTSDNGGERFSDTWPLVGGKMDLTEGGIRVPWIAHWPHVIAPNQTSKQQCMTMDWSATVIDCAGATPKKEFPLDGVSLLSVLQSPAHEFERPLFWRMNHKQQKAYRLGDWKYLKVNEHEYLFNLNNDERERSNQRHKYPEIFEQMKATCYAWEATVPEIAKDAAISLGYGIADMPLR